MKVFKKKSACNGTVIEHPAYGEVIQLRGNQCICQLLVEAGLAESLAGYSLVLSALAHRSLSEDFLAMS